MPRVTFSHVFTATLAIAIVAGSVPARGGAPAALGQADAGYLANVRDLEITVTRSASENVTDVSLGLAPPTASTTPGPATGASGVTLLFRARFKGQTVDADRLAGIVVRAHYRAFSDDRVRSAQALDRSQQLHMSLDPQDPNGIGLDFFPASWGYFGFTPPGDEIPVAFFTVTPEDLRALSIARAVTGEVLWTKFTLTRAELDALAKFTRQVLPGAR